VAVAYSAVGAGAHGTSINALAFTHAIGASDNCLMVGVGAYYGSSGYSSWTRSCGITAAAVTCDSVGAGIANGSYTGGTAQTCSHTVVHSSQSLHSDGG